MRKQTKLVAVLSAAALLAIGASMTSFADTPHWDQEDGEWVYLDRNGDKVTDEWKKSNGQWYYLDSDGYMAKDQVIEDDDDKYYVDENGARVTNAWVSFDNDDLLDDDDETEEIDTVWMYFDSTGKAYGCDTDNGEIKKITYGDGKSGWFIFNEDGYMLSGFKKWSKSGNSDKLYYLGDQNEGWAHTGWQYLEVDTDLDAFSGIDEDDAMFEDQAWFYFKSNGKAVVDEDKEIGGKKYIFDEYGRMLDLWVYPTATDSGYTNDSNASSSSASAQYFQEDNGGRDKNWIWAHTKSDYDDYGDDPFWFYLDSNGKPFRAVEGTKLTGVGTSMRIDDDDKQNKDDDKYNGEVGCKSIKGETYMFNDKGVMLRGLYLLGYDNEEDFADATAEERAAGGDSPVYKGTSTTPMEAGYYYFTVDDSHGTTDGRMVDDKKMKIDIDGEDETYYFKKSGAAYTNTIINDTVYGPNGQLVDDYGDGSDYQVVALWADLYKKGNSNKVEVYAKDPETGEQNYILINEHGKIKKSGSTTDVDDQKVKVKDYVVYSIEEDD